MDFGLSNEQEMIIDSVKSFVEQELYPHEDEVEQSNKINKSLAENIKKRQSIKVFMLVICQKYMGAVVLIL